VELNVILARSMQRRGALALALLPLSWLFAAVAALRRLLFRLGVLKRQRVDVPVIVVGNITVGGSGKTPLVLWLAERLRERGLRPGIVSRGHGGAATAPRVVRPEDDPGLVGDEPLLLARRSGCPVWIARRRPAAARALLAARPECDVLIADDGLQHYALARDVEIVVVDERGPGNGWFLPAGPLREPLSRLRRVDALVINGGALPRRLPAAGMPRTFFMHLGGGRFYRLGAPQVTCGPEELRGKALHAMAGIGNPQRFFDHLAKLGLRFVPHPFPDHHRYTAADLAFATADGLLMTEKDAVKCEAFAPPDAWVVPVDAHVASAPAASADANGLLELVLEKLDGRTPA
jgi:tetraacyldisaccharide 4'-kinase